MAQQYTSKGFWEAYGKLPNDIRDLADKCFEILKSSPQHPSLRFKKVGSVYSARVGLHHRAVALSQGEDFFWFWIGTHAEYDALLRAL